MSEYNTNDKRFWLGIIFVIFGGIWLLDNLDFIPYYFSDILFSWGSFLTLIGVYLLLGRKKVEAGIIFIAIGGILILQDMGFFYIRNIWQIFLPAMVIIIGISLIAIWSTCYFVFLYKKDSVVTGNDGVGFVKATRK